jgi:hypothetical protein
VALRGVLDAAGILSPTIVAALLVGVAYALWRPGRARIGPVASGGAQATIGVVLGALLNGAALTAIGEQWLPSLLSIVAAFAVSIGIGAVLERRTSLDISTAMLGMVPGGAVGIVAMTRELGGDDRLVAFSQYLRVFVILLLTPLVVTVAFGGGPGEAAHAPAAATGVEDLLVTAGLAAAGWAAARAAGLTAASLMGPLLLTGAVTLVATGHAPSVPPLLREVAFALVGLDVGLRFTRATLAHVRQLLGALLLGVAGILGLSLLIAVGLDAATSLSLLDAYLATTPGGLTVVAATAYGAGANIAIVVGLQSVRTILMVILAPATVRLAVRVLGQRQRKPTGLGRGSSGESGSPSGTSGSL